ncbi:MAG: EamA family transporter, partial [Reyranella sp.]|nr:EamA family transporter [Reyranella sp.]
GLAAGSAFASSVVGYRGATLALDAGSPCLGAAGTLFWSQLTQTVLLGAWLLVRTPSVVLGVLHQWRLSLFAGLAGASASAASVTALALESASNVRTLILIEVLFTYFVSLRIFRETISRRELAGIALVVLGVALVLSSAN